MERKGFTLIELLVVIAILGILATIILVSVNNARAKARDTRRIADLKQIQTAILMYYDTHNAMPANQTPGFGYCDSQSNFLQELVADGLIQTYPKDPRSPSYRYCYYDYGPGNSIGALIVATLEAAPPSTTGIPPSCRPWAPEANWCSQSSNTYYCLCNPY